MIKPVFYITILFLVFTSTFWAQQNLVPNGSFEEYYSCPTAPGSVGDDQLERCKYWYKPTRATTDYYNACQTNLATGVSVPNNWFGSQQAFDGKAYIGIGTYVDQTPENCEYAQIKLLHSLEPCKLYSVRFWVSLSDYSSRATNTLGARLDKQAITQISPFDFNGFELPAHISSTLFIKDTSNWTLISGIYEATGGEEYLTIGRFLDTLLYSNYNVPNITVNCDSCFPLENTAHYYVDSVSVIETEQTSKVVSLPNILTADNNGINDFWYPSGICFGNWSCEILNRWGNLVFKFSESETGWNGLDIRGDQLSDGVYYYKIASDKEIKTGFIQLIR